MNNFARAKELLNFTRKAPLMYALTKDSYLNRVASILEMSIIDFDSISFYEKHLKKYYINSDITLDQAALEDFDDDWGQDVVDDALKIIDAHILKIN